MAPTSPAPAPAPAPSAGTAVVVLRWLVVVTLLALFVQFALAGYGSFTTLHPNHPHGSYDAHEKLGQGIGVLELLVVIAALVARRWRDAIVAAVAFLLVMPTQMLLADAGRNTAAIGAVHAFVGVVIVVLTGWLLADIGWRGAPRATASPGR
jgi:uncharacterized membrane protein YhaH (DUF805 family)